MQKYVKVNPLPPYAPLFASIKYYRLLGFTVKAFAEHGDEITVGQEWEFDTRLAVDHAVYYRHGYLGRWRNLYLSRLGHWDSSGDSLYEIPLPPVRAPADVLDVSRFAMQTALLFVLEVPVAQNGVSGRHLHITPTFAGGTPGVGKAVKCAAPLFASRIEVDGDRMIPVFRESLSRYSVVKDVVGTSHYDAVNINPAERTKPSTLEVRHAETVPLIAGVGAWVVYNVLRDRAPKACGRADRTSFFSDLAREVCNDEYCREVLETYRQMVESSNGPYEQTWRSLKPLYPLISNQVARLLDVLEEMRGVTVKKTGRGYEATCYRCESVPAVIESELPTTFERVVELS